MIVVIKTSIEMMKMCCGIAGGKGLPGWYFAGRGPDRWHSVAFSATTLF